MWVVTTEVNMDWWLAVYVYGTRAATSNSQVTVLSLSLSLETINDSEVLSTVPVRRYVLVVVWRAACHIFSI